MHYSKIKQNDISNGPGIRTTIYVSGCRNKCNGCFNTETWDFKYGNEFNDETLELLLNSCAPNYIQGLTLLGGEPLEPENQKIILKIILAFKEKYSDKDIWLFSGYLFDYHIKKWCEELPYTKSIIENIDVLVDGRFDIDLKDIELGFRGSSNQRIIDVKNSLLSQEIVLHEKQNNKESRRVWK